MNKMKNRKKARRLGVPDGGSKTRSSVLLFLIALAVLFFQNVPPAFGQPRDVPPPPPGLGPLKVFIDSPFLDPASFVQGKLYLALVPRREEAQVYVHVTARQVNGKDTLSVILTGQHEFAGVRDELPCIPEPGLKPDEIQKELGQTIELGLMRYIARSPLGGRVRVNLMDQVSPTAVVDPWNFWVFSLSATSFLSGQESYRSQMWFGSFSATRVTPEWKIRLALNGMYEKDHYDYSGYVYDSSLNSKRTTGLIVRSLSDHWSAGIDYSVSASSFSNTRLAFGLAPGIEYDVFPYSESTKKQLRILYRLGFQRVRYIEETIYDKTAETLWLQVLSATLELNRSWGTVSTTLQGSNYLQDFSKYNLELNAEISFRIFHGLSFNLDGGAAWIHDQLSLAKGGASLEDVILQRKQLSTSYNYFFMVGLNFTFGSVRSNIVNPRFGSPGGGGYSMRISM